MRESNPIHLCSTDFCADCNNDRIGSSVSSRWGCILTSHEGRYVSRGFFNCDSFDSKVCLLLLQCSICAVYSCASVGYFAETGEHEFFSYVNYVQDPEVLKQVLIWVSIGQSPFLCRCTGGKCKGCEFCNCPTISVLFLSDWCVGLSMWNQNNLCVLSLLTHMFLVASFT